jgi:ubiquinone/menaquinone biosynthesis C-methylase UbiE
MDSERQEIVRSSYNKMSKVYGLLSNGSEKRFVKEAIQKVLKPREGERVLEPGFGTGQVLVALAGEVGESGKVYGIDISDGMVEATRKRLVKEGLAGRVELVRGDACEMPYDDDSFDAIFMSFTLELFDDSDIPVVLSECMRVLKEDGRLCVASMSNQGKDGVMMKTYVWSHKKFPNFVDCRPIFARKAVEDAGFKVTNHEIMSMWGLAVEIILGVRPGFGPEQA